MLDSEDGLWYERFGITAGAKFETKKRAYFIEKILGEGGFGAVFKIYPEGDPALYYAMKVEKRIEPRRHSKLEMERHILKIANERKATNEQNHFTDMVECGKKESFYFLIMQLVGKSLQDLKKEFPLNIFSLATGLGVGIQCLEAIENLHKLGFIHRDVKPANFACGFGELKHTIYILDFGIARKFKNNKGELKTPRARVYFKGTVRFASLACHRGIEMSRKDDVESWFYLLLDLIVQQGLPWKNKTDRKAVQQLKQLSRKQKNLYGHLNCKEDYEEILSYIDSLEYADGVDFQYIYQKLKQIGMKQVLNIEKPYDFEYQ